ncbi:MAG: pro-sigmaK processing inhibitor BofA family protein [Clostridia bacterium]|nr:pro-sigmaK processing inhibitor BofA family protein [Clostridia bacterium]
MNLTLFLIIIGTILGCILIAVFSKPLGLILKVAVNSALGGVCIIAFNFVSQIFGFFIGVNALTAVTVGILGIPGFIMLLMLRLILN